MTPPRDPKRSERAQTPEHPIGPQTLARDASAPTAPSAPASAARVGWNPDPFGVDLDPTCAGSIVGALDRDGIRVRRTGPRWWDAVASGPRLPACDVSSPDLEAYIAKLVVSLGDYAPAEGFVVRRVIDVLVDRAVARAVRAERERVHRAKVARLEAVREAEIERIARGRP